MSTAGPWSDYAGRHAAVDCRVEGSHGPERPRVKPVHATNWRDQPMASLERRSSGRLNLPPVGIPCGKVRLYGDGEVLEAMFGRPGCEGSATGRRAGPDDKLLLPAMPRRST